MAQPTQGDAHYDAILSAISIAYLQEAKEFAAPLVMPVRAVQHRSDRFWTYPRAAWFREEAQLRAESTESAGSGYGLSTDSFYCDVYAVHKDISDQLRANADDPIDLDGDAAKWVARQLLMKWESEFVRTFIAASVWTGAATGVDQTGVSGTPGTNQFKQWDDITSDPIGDITNYIDQMQEITSYKPNTLVVGPRVAAALRNHPDIIDRVKYTQRGIIGLDIVAQAMGVDRIVEARATRNTAAEGATDSYSYYVGKNALLCYVNPNIGPMSVSAGVTFAWTGYTGTGGVEGIGTGAATRKFRQEAIRSDRVEGEIAMDMKVLAADLGVYLGSAVA